MRCPSAKLPSSTEDALDIVAGTVPDTPEVSRSLPARRPDAGELGGAVTGPRKCYGCAGSGRRGVFECGVCGGSGELTGPLQAHADSSRKGALRLLGPDHRREAKRPPAIRSRRRRRPADA